LLDLFGPIISFKIGEFRDALLFRLASFVRTVVLTFFLHSQGANRRPGGGRHAFPFERQDAELQRFYSDPSTSTRTVAAREGVARSTICRIATADGLYRYHRQTVQKLMPGDDVHGMDLATWVLDRVEGIILNFQIPFFHMDEARFNQIGIYNQHNIHDWQHVNPINTLAREDQQRFSVTLWVGMARRYIIGPHIMPAQLDDP